MRTKRGESRTIAKQTLGRRVDATRPSAAELTKLVDGEFQWYMQRASATNDLVPGASMDVIGAWDVAGHCGDSETVIGFIDDGFDLTHPDLDRVNVKARWELDDDLVPRKIATMVAGPRDFHGTACLGLALGRPRDKGGVVGVAPGCSAALVRYDASLDLSYLSRMLKAIGPTVDVVCLAFGPDSRDGYDLSADLDETIHSLASSGGPRKKGIVFCVAAGNQNAPVSRQFVKDWPWVDFVSGEGRDPKKNFSGLVHDGLAAHRDVLTVGASSSRNRHAAYSNWGRQLSICAPSNDYHPLSWRKEIRYTDRTRQIRVPWNRMFRSVPAAGLHRTDFGGTSAAVALVAGAVGLIRAANPNLTAAQVRQIVIQKADKIVDAAPDEQFKNRFGEYGPGSRCNWFGFGKLNVESAVRAAIKASQAPAAV